jgi:hypothetical protein
MKSYSDKLKDPRWQKKRLEILSRDRFACQYCDDETNTLHVHHKYYNYTKEPWEYNPEFLITLCSDCHESEELQLKQYSALMIDTLRKSKFRADDFRELAHGIHQMDFQHLPNVVASAYMYAFADPKMQKLIIEKYFEHLES